MVLYHKLCAKKQYYFTKINEIRNSYDWFIDYLNWQTQYTAPEDIVDDSGISDSIPDLLQHQKDLGYSNEWAWLPYTPPVVPGGSIGGGGHDYERDSIKQKPEDLSQLDEL